MSSARRSPDLAITGGTVVFPGAGERAVDLGIRDGHIAAIAAPGTELDAPQTTDASGLHIFPGLIEPHAHWGLGADLEDFRTESRSAARGGVSTVLVFLRHKDPYDRLFEAYRDAGERTSITDFGFHAVLLTERHLAEVDHCADDLGIKSFKFYLTARSEEATLWGVDGIDDGFMLDCFRAVARDPSRLLIAHCENVEVVQRTRAALRDAGEDGMDSWQRSRPLLAEVDGIRRACLFAQDAGCRLNVLHLTSEAGLQEIRDFRRRYPPIFAEVCHTYLALCDEDGLTIAAKVKPTLRTTRDRDALWDALGAGEIQTVGSDHVPRRLETKEGSVWSPATGVPGTATLLPLLLSEGHHRRGMPLARIAEATSLASARLYGLYPRKGAIEIGSDADLCFVDLESVREVRAGELESHADYSLYEGWKLKGWPVHTMVRGRWAMRDEEIQTEGIGSYVGR